MQFPNIDPILFQIDIFGFTLALRWYALAYIGGILLGWWLALRVMARADLWSSQGAPMTKTQTDDFVTWAIIGIIAGGRLGFVIFYQPAYYLSNPGDIIAVWDGGMSFHGGFLGVCTAILLFSWRHKLRLMSVADIVAFVVPMGLFFGRVANFINAELWGRPTTVPWGFSFPGARAQTCPDFWTEACVRHPSQLYEAILEGAVLMALMAVAIFSYKMLRKPGFVAGMFFAGYGFARTFVEFFRQGDAQYVSVDNPFGQVIRFGDSAWAGLSMGQLLSIPMIIVGIVVMIWARKRA